MRKQETLDEINDWALSNYASTAAPSLNAAVAPAPATSTMSGSGMLAASAPTAVAAPASPAAASTPAQSSASTWAAAASTPSAPAATATPATPAAAAKPAASTATPAVATTPAYKPAGKVDINNWYRNELGRDGDANGIAFWQQRLDSGVDPEVLYSEFAKAAKTNAEIVKPTDWASANTYTGAVSANTNSIADEWGRNVLGRPLTSAEQAQWDAKLAGATTAAQGQAVYQDFVNTYGSQVKNNVSLAQASQIAPGATGGTTSGTGTGTTGTGGTGTTGSTTPATTGANAAQIAKGDLATRTVDKPTETVQGQLGNLLAENSPVLQQAKADAMRTAADRGMLNSAMAASGGEDALIRSATGIATTDSATYGKAADYNTAAQNQATMWNADQVGQMQRLQMQQNADAAARAQQLEIAKMQDATSRYQSEMSANTSRYNVDASYKQQMDNQKQSLVNSVINNMDLSPDRKAAMLESLGEGTSARANPDGTSTPGTGLAGAAYVIGSTAADLQYNPAQG
jgi:hypothetical protein